jgi:hypothetical protein
MDFKEVRWECIDKIRPLQLRRFHGHQNNSTDYYNMRRISWFDKTLPAYQEGIANVRCVSIHTY